MADVKKFTGYVAPDGSTHDTIKKATDHTRDLKIKKALEGFKDVTYGVNPGVGQDDADNSAIYPESLPEFLFAHKATILAAFNQDVLMRAPRKPKVVTPLDKAVLSAPAKTAAPAPVNDAAPAHEGLIDLDE